LILDLIFFLIFSGIFQQTKISNHNFSNSLILCSKCETFLTSQESETSHKKAVFSGIGFLFFEEIIDAQIAKSAAGSFSLNHQTVETKTSVLSSFKLQCFDKIAIWIFRRFNSIQDAILLG
jgi:hypothetical protein